MKIVFTGGHHNSALVVASALEKKGFKIYWFGHKHTMKNDKSLSAEYLEVKRHKLPFYEIKTGKFYKTVNLFSWFKIGLGFFQSFILLYKLKPKFIVSFGGYLAVPVVLAGYLLKIPSITHEQTTQAGMANLTLARFVKKVFLTWPSSLKFFPKSKVEVVGLPMDTYFFKAKKINIFNNNLPTLFIIGGKQGSHLINNILKNSLPRLLNKFNIIHQSGRVIKTGDFESLQKLKAALPAELQTRYKLKPYFFKKELVNNMVSSDLIISRSGAHIIYELMALGKPAILIPISWVYKNEQRKNAEKLQKLKMAVVISEKGINSIKLEEEINFCIKNLSNLK
ncbi:glycosyltransferase, partial [Patescibacteria group bacterium]